MSSQDQSHLAFHVAILPPDVGSWGVGGGGGVLIVGMLPSDRNTGTATESLRHNWVTPVLVQHSTPQTDGSVGLSRA